MESSGSVAPLRVWILTSDKGGDNAQMRALARAAGLGFLEIPLEFNALRKRSNLRLGASLRSVTAEARQRLQPPWPDLVLCSGRKTVSAARWIRQQSGGRTKLVSVGRPWGRLAWFDLVLAMPQYALPDRTNVMQMRMPFNAPEAAALDVAAEQWRPRLAAYPRPWIGLLVGGKSNPLILDAAAAADIAAKVSQRARETGGSVLAMTSRRTSALAANVLFAGIDAPGLKYRWRQEGHDNPYLAVLALADEFVVTGDSASMLAEAVRRNRPLAIAPLSLRFGRRRRRVKLAQRLLPRRVFDLLVDLAVITRIRDVRRLQRRLLDEGLASMLGDKPTLPPAFVDDVAIAAARVRELAGLSPQARREGMREHGFPARPSTASNGCEE